MLRPRGKKGIIYLKRRVPKEFATVHASPFVELSLKTDSMEDAQAKATALWEQLEQGWQDRMDGRSDDAEKKFEAARRIARSRGFRYRQMGDVAQGRLEEVLDRVEAIPVSKNQKPDVDVGAALLGAVERPNLNVSRALEKYWEFSAASKLGKSVDQIRRWENPKKKAVKSFIEVVGDLDLTEISPDDMQDFQDWWLERIELEGLTANSANKDFTHLASVLKVVAKKMRLGFEPPVSGWRIVDHGLQNQRPPFSVDWLRKQLIPHLESSECRLNGEARDIILIMINTGARPSEVASLRPETIHLDGIPHISIEPLERQIKTATSRRAIPLVGVSLDAARRNPEGFPRYWDKPGFSATANKYLRTNDLMETDRHVLYSLRHSFEDRMLGAQVDERVRRDLMGHGLDGRQRYGTGLPLGDLRDLLQSIAM